jgi:hypothetical protein
MNRRDWLQHISIVFGIAFGVALFLFVGDLAGKGYFSKQQAKSISRSDCASKLLALGYVASDQAGNDDNLCQQIRMAEAAERAANAAEYSLYVLIIAAVVTGAAAKFAFDSSSQASRQADAAFEAVRVQRQEKRAWLKLAPVAVGSVGYDDRSLRVNITVKAENIGASPATNVFFWLSAYQAHGLVVGADEVRRVVAQAKLLGEQKDALGLIVLPDGHAECVFHTDATTLGRRRGAGWHRDESEGSSTVVSAVYCVFYKTAGEWHHTAQAMWITKCDGSHFDVSDGEIPPEMLSVNVLSPLADIS